jgi:hypothetical protein
MLHQLQRSTLGILTRLRDTEVFYLGALFLIVFSAGALLSLAL